MGLFDIFQKGGKYFGKEIQAHCEYCDYGKRAKDGSKVLCDKRGLVDADFSCGKFVYSPLKRIPVKQMNRVGLLDDDDLNEDPTPEETSSNVRQTPPPLEQAPVPEPIPAPASVVEAPAAPSAEPMPEITPVSAPEATAASVEEAPAENSAEEDEFSAAALAAEAAMEAAFKNINRPSN